MRLGIDAVNIRDYGGLTHLSQLLTVADPEAFDFKSVTVWGNERILDLLPHRSWLIKRSAPWMNGPLPQRIIGHQVWLPVALKSRGCDVIFSPGGSLPRGCGIPTVTMSQNMLPFESDRAQLFGRFNRMTLKMWLLRTAQGQTFSRADGIIFLTDYALDVVGRVVRMQGAQTTKIPHGVESRFFMRPREQRSSNAISEANPLRLLYVSQQWPYKHHIELLNALEILRRRGIPVELQMAGNNSTAYGKLVRQERQKIDPSGSFIKDLGHVEFGQLHLLYQQADVFVFPSSCENLPISLIEAMAAGLPIACSRRGPMPEILGDAGRYFNPEVVSTIVDAVVELVENESLRAKLAQNAWSKAQAYSWEGCAEQTFCFLAQIARGGYHNGKRLHV